MTGRPGCPTMEMFGGSAASYLARTPRIPQFVLIFIGLETKNVFRLPGAGGGALPLYSGPFARSYSVLNKTKAMALAGQAPVLQAQWRAMREIRGILSCVLFELHMDTFEGVLHRGHQHSQHERRRLDAFLRGYHMLLDAWTQATADVIKGHKAHRQFTTLVTRIAATSNRKSLATAIATQKNHCDSESTP